MKSKNKYKVCPLCLGKGKLFDRHHYSDKTRASARKLYADGKTLREIGKVIGVDHPQKVMSLIKAKTL